MITRIALALALIAAVMTPAGARTRVSPYIEVQQVLDADLGNGGDVLTYTTVAAGVDVSASSRRVEAQISYRYERRIPNDRSLTVSDIHSGLARMRASIVPDLLSLEAGGIATRTRTDIRGAAPVFLTGDAQNVSQLYGVYGGPTLAKTIGDVSVAASYRLGYVTVDEDIGVTLPGGQPVRDRYDHATTHNLTASMAMPAGALPFGWTVSGGYAREDASQLDQRYEAKYARGDIVLPVSATLALVGGVGYENIEISERAVLRDGNGVPLRDAEGRFRTDPGSARLLAYQTDGLIYDAGVIWRPNRRTTIEARGGYRYGGTMFTASLDYQIRANAGLRIGVYDMVDSLGRSLTRGLAGLPTSFDVSRNPLTGDFNGCVFGTTPGTGGCLGDSLQSIATANYRSRGVSILFGATRGPWRFGLGGGYANRKYLARDNILAFGLDGVVDESAGLSATINRRFSERSGINNALYANWYGSSIAAAPDVYNYGATSSYYRYFTDRLSGQATLGLYGYDQSGFDSRLAAQLILGARYQF
jgi:uncharacterized protein (PEP-CTERM system associated)